MRTNPRKARITILDLLPERKVTVDPEAMTLQEMAVARGYSESRMRKFVLPLYEAGRLERVYKRVNGKLASAYRVADKKKKAKKSSKSNNL